MSKKGIATFLYVAFLFFIISPAILLIVDDKMDTSIFFSISEEEEKSNEKDLDIEILLSSIDSNYQHLVFILSENNLDYLCKNYPKPLLNIISPPPELNVL